MKNYKINRDVSRTESKGKEVIRLALFDMDGTVFESYLNWAEIKKTMAIKTGNILKEIYAGGSVDTRKLEMLETYEEDNSLKTKPITGIEEFLSYLAEQQVNSALITNNNKRNTDYLLKKFNLSFDLVITREMNLWKPEPHGLLYAMEFYHRQPHETISIGDSNYDVWASREAGIKNIYIIQTPGKIIDTGNNVHFFSDYFELKQIIKGKFYV
jgi:HAD superfamily hydrolase (TIGR01549 family)